MKYVLRTADPIKTVICAGALKVRIQPSSSEFLPNLYLVLHLPEGKQIKNSSLHQEQYKRESNGRFFARNVTKSKEG